MTAVSRSYELVVHVEKTENGDLCWWAVSDALPGFSAADGTLARLRGRIVDYLNEVDPGYGHVHLVLTGPEESGGVREQRFHEFAISA